jgi:hypothetical protein
MYINLVKIYEPTLQIVHHHFVNFHLPLATTVTRDGQHVHKDEVKMNVRLMRFQWEGERQ